MTMITPSYLGETIEYSSLHACRSTLEDPTTVTSRSSFGDRQTPVARGRRLSRLQATPRITSNRSSWWNQREKLTFRTSLWLGVVCGSFWRGQPDMVQPSVNIGLLGARPLIQVRECRGKGRPGGRARTRGGSVIIRGSPPLPMSCMRFGMTPARGTSRSLWPLSPSHNKSALGWGLVDAGRVAQSTETSQN